jgi:hypothetical protein
VGMRSPPRHHHAQPTTTSHSLIISAGQPCISQPKVGGSPHCESVMTPKPRKQQAALPGLVSRHSLSSSSSSSHLFFGKTQCSWSTKLSGCCFYFEVQVVRIAAAVQPGGCSRPFQCGEHAAGGRVQATTRLLGLYAGTGTRGGLLGATAGLEPSAELALRSAVLSVCTLLALLLRVSRSTAASHQLQTVLLLHSAPQAMHPQPEQAPATATAKQPPPGAFPFKAPQLQCTW